MRRISLLLALLASVSAGCDNGTETPDGGPVDAGPPPPCMEDTDCPATYCNPGSMLCCVPTSPAYEICGDGIDQNCDRRDASCGDEDRDGVQACRPGEDPLGGTCDCDDSRNDVRPRVGAIGGAIEACDGIDNDCNGRIDGGAACCEGCASLGEDRDRADVCTEDGTCDCSSDPGMGPCAEGMTCCTVGCVDVQTDVMNCGFCNAVCTVSADSCVAGNCACGETGPCELDNVCSGGMCPMM